MADNFTTPVADGTTFAAKEIGAVKYPWNLIADAAGADAFGLVTASPAAFSLLGRLKTANDTLADIATSLDAATPAGENYTGKTGGDVLVSTAVPTVTTIAYASGDVIGTKMTLTGAARLAAGSGMLQSVALHAKSAQTAAVDLLIFSADPSATTINDNAALALAAADFDKLVGVVHLTDWTALGTPSIAQAHGLAMAFKLAAGTSLYAVLVARAAMTLASTSDLTLSTRVIPG